MINLLLVSSDDDSLSTLAAALAKHNDVHVLQERSGAAALENIANQNYDLMIIDENPDDITGQPMPGGPSVRIRSASVLAASWAASFLTTVTSLPEFSSAMPKRACTMGPNRVSEINHSPQV